MDNNNDDDDDDLRIFFAGKRPAAFGRWGQHPVVVLVGENPGRDFILIFPP